MNKLAIRIDTLSKRYKIGAARHKHDTLRDQIMHGVGSLFRRKTNAPPNNESFWALKEVSFEIQKGEVIGIIGRNGAGKSTLLKILSRITDPTEGRAEIFGRVGSLLEVGTGFHPELTGRENIYLNGAILGMRKVEIDDKFDEIVAFSEVGKFLDTPVKHYSSGMYVRLAFAVAAHLEPEILIIDEVLAVGDASFQKKCLGKMGDVAKHGRTVLFVSHNMIAVNSLCERVFWLDEGHLADDGPAGAIVSRYLQSGSTSSNNQLWNDLKTSPGNDIVRLHRVRVFAEKHTDHDSITMQTPFMIETEYWILKPDAKIHITYHFYNDQGLIIFTSGSGRDTLWPWSRPRPPGLYLSTSHVPANLLNSGTHSITLLVVEDGNRVIYSHEAVVSFDIIDVQEKEAYMDREPGMVQPVLEWTTSQLGDLSATVE